MQPLKGITIFTLEHAIAAPFATRHRWTEIGSAAGPLPALRADGAL